MQSSISNFSFRKLYGNFLFQHFALFLTRFIVVWEKKYLISSFMRSYFTDVVFHHQLINFQCYHTLIIRIQKTLTNMFFPSDLDLFDKKVLDFVWTSTEPNYLNYIQFSTPQLLTGAPFNLSLYLIKQMPIIPTMDIKAIFMMCKSILCWLLWF